MRRWYGLTSAWACYQQPVNGLRSFPLSVVRPSCLPLIGFGYTLLFSLHSFLRYPHSIHGTKIRGFYTYTSNLGTARISSASFYPSGIPQSSKPRFWVESQAAYEYDPSIPLPLQSSPFSIRTTAAVFSRFPCVSHRRTPCADISARIRCDICSSILYALNCLCHSLLSGLSLFCSLQLPDRISTITEGVLFFPIGRSLF